jgi:sugar O-acyltransferase (sialic acid O-acetyltransferase NeuD family)
LNANEPEAQLIGLHVQPGQPVAPGDLLCTLETTKSAAEVEAESGGYVAGLVLEEGDMVKAGDIFCYLADSPDWRPPESQSQLEAETAAVPADLRITEPALALTRQHKLDLAALPTGTLLTETAIQQLVAERQSGQLAVPESAFDPSALVIYGGGGHGKALIDLVRALGTYRIVGVVDDGLQKGTEIMSVPVLGGAESLADLYAQGVRLAVNAVGGIGNIATRVKVFETILQAGSNCPVLVHPTAFVEPSATLSPGVQVFPHAYVGSDAEVGFGAIVNTGAIVSHDCELGAYANIAPGAMLAGAVQIGSGALIGMGATVNLSVVVGSNAKVGNGATVKTDVPENGIVRAGTVWPA